MGGNYYETADMKTGELFGPDATMLGPAWYGDVERLKKELRLVSVFGGADDMVPAEQGRVDHESLRLDGFQHTYVELPGHAHSHPDFSTFQRALAALARLTPPPATGPTHDNERPHPDQVAQARRLLTTAKVVYQKVSRISAPPSPAKARLAQLAANDPTYDTALARRCLTKLLADYSTTPAVEEGRALLDKLNGLAVPGQTNEAAAQEIPSPPPRNNNSPSQR
jgi:hypothetical protein